MADDWRDDLTEWLRPFVATLGNRRRARMCPAYVEGLIGPGDRKSVQPMAMRSPGIGYDQLHHFIGAALWDSAPLEKEPCRQADALVGGSDAWLIIDDTALPKKERASVGVAPQYASALGKKANCQTLVSVTLASGEVPVMIGLRLFLPESWTGNTARMDRAKVPDEARTYRDPSRRSPWPRSTVCAAQLRALAVSWPTPAMACLARSGRRSPSVD